MKSLKVLITNTSRRLGEISMKITAVVFKKNGKQKEGRGFSKEELCKAALGFRKALKVGIPVDLKRRTLHEENVEALREYMGSLKKAEMRKKRESQLS
jgi:large subunit ribosomal protein L13e